MTKKTNVRPYQRRNKKKNGKHSVSGHSRSLPSKKGTVEPVPETRNTMMGGSEFGERWDYPDAEYEKKEIDIDNEELADMVGDRYYVELVYGKDRGGMIRIWSDADEEDYESASRLPHIYNISDGKIEEAQVNFMHWENAKAEFEDLNSESDITNLMYRNR